MDYKEFCAEAAMVVACKIRVKDGIVKAKYGTVKACYRAFVKEHPEYSECTMDYEYNTSDDSWTITVLSSTDVIFKEVK